jgi:hypothetical protein
VTVDRSLSVGSALWAYWRSIEFTPNSLCDKGYIEIETDTLNGSNEEVGSNSIAFDLVIQ